MKSFVGTGTGSASNAVEQAIRGIDKPSAIIFISGYNILEETSRLLCEKFPGVLNIGTIGTSFANGKIIESQLVVLGLYSDAKTSMGVIEDISVCPILQTNKLEKSLSEVGADKDNTVCIEYCTGSEEKLVTTIQSVLGRKKISLAGGTVFGVPDGKPALVAFSGMVYEDACVYAVIRNTTGKAKVYKENIYKRIPNSKVHYATKVSPENRGLIELDGRNASDVYCEEIGISKNQIIDNVLKNPMGRAVGDEVYISSMKEMGSNGAILNYKRINKNDCMYFLELADYEETEAETRAMIKQDMRSISLVFSIDCVYRYLLYNGEKYTQTYASNMASLGQHFGVVGGGEQYNNQHVNQTMVCAVFE